MKFYILYILLLQKLILFILNNFFLPLLYLCTNQQTRQVCVLCFSLNLIMTEMQYKLFPTK